MLAEARSRGYGLLGQLLLRGLTADTLPRLRLTPLSSLVPKDADLDQLAAAHHRLLSMEIHPYASLFLTPDPAGCIDPIRDAARSAGFHIDAASARPDHLGIGLLLLSFLSGATADALTDGKADIARQTEVLAQSFLATWLIPWLPPLCAAVSAHDDGLWAAVVSTAAELAGDHWSGAGSLILPEPPSLLTESRTDLRAIATFLLTPCHCGVYLSRADIGGLSRSVSVPRGFGSRQQELTNLLRTSAEYGELGALMTRLDALMVKRSAQMTGAFAAVWQARIASAQTMVAVIREVVEKKAQSVSL
ncbi:MAG: TorA maturation chaperone TorD [Myxococcota bacterium]|jgi:TorA maturation chaperone TorD